MTVIISLHCDYIYDQHSMCNTSTRAAADSIETLRRTARTTDGSPPPPATYAPTTQAVARHRRPGPGKAYIPCDSTEKSPERSTALAESGPVSVIQDDSTSL